MFGIGGGEFIVIVLVCLMFFGSDKIPELARALGKGMAQLKNATNDIKSEIAKGAEANGLGSIADEINKAKEGFTKMVNDSSEQSGIKSELEQIRENFAKMNEAEIVKAKMPDDIPPDVVVPETPPVIEPVETPDGQVKRQV
jgi:sec-independent protein translocase protein TatA